MATNVNDLNVGENINLLFEKLESFLTSKTVIGQSIQVGDATLIPIIDISFGLGSGGGNGSDNKSSSSGTGGGAGAGAKISPRAIIVIKGDKIEILPIKKMGGLEKLLEMVPSIMNEINKHKENEKNGEETEK